MRIIFCGVGALGSTAAASCRNLDATLRFIDFDRVEGKNLLAQAYVKPSLGKNKAMALKLQFQNFWGVKTEAFGVRLAENNCAELLAQGDLLVDAFDNVASRLMLSKYAKANSKALVHAGISGDGDFGIVRWDEHFTADPEDEVGQATCEGGEHLPMIGLLSSTLARTIQDFATTSAKHNYMVALGGVTRTHV